MLRGQPVLAGPHPRAAAPQMQAHSAIEPGLCPLKRPGLDRGCTAGGRTTGRSALTPAGGARRLCGRLVTRLYLCSHRAIRDMHPPPSDRRSCLHSQIQPPWPGSSRLIGPALASGLIQSHADPVIPPVFAQPLPGLSPLRLLPGHRALLSLRPRPRRQSSAPSASALKVRGAHEEPSQGAAEGRFLHSHCPAPRAHAVGCLQRLRRGEERTEGLPRVPPPCGCGPCSQARKLRLHVALPFFVRCTASSSPPQNAPPQP